MPEEYPLAAATVLTWGKVYSLLYSLFSSEWVQPWVQPFIICDRESTAVLIVLTFGKIHSHTKKHRARAIFALGAVLSRRFMSLRYRARAVFFCVWVYLRKTGYNEYSVGGAR